MKRRRNTVILTSLVALITLLMIPAAVFADAEPVRYLDENGTECTADNCVSTSGWPKDESYPVLVGNSEEGKWYVLDSDVTYSEYRLTILGKVNLILKDGCTLNARRGIRMAANTAEGASLTVYAQSTSKESMGAIIADASGVESCAGIGGNDAESGGKVVIIGGNITATGGEHAAGIGGGEDRGGDSVTIKGGIVTATGGEYGAGIGGGEGGSGGDINIEDGTVTANGGLKAAGVGGGQKWHGGGNGGTIVIGRASGTTKLDLTATAGNEGAGIGGGEDGEGGNITIHSGKVTASGNNNGRGAGIGGGVDAHAGIITINGGEVTAFGGVAKHSDYTSAGGGAGIGAGYDNDSGSKSKTAGGHIIINGGKVKGVGGYAALDNGGAYSSGAGIGSGEDGYGLRIEIHGGEIDAMSPGLSGASIGGGYKGAGGVISIDNKVSDPSVHATTNRGNRGNDSNHAIGDGGYYSGDSAEVTFDYPSGKVWIEWYFWGHDDGERIVAASERASVVAAGNGSHREIRITPCDHPGMKIKKADNGHKCECRCCSKFEGKVFPHNYAWKHNEQRHWKVCLDCGAEAENGEHTFNDDKCSQCGFDRSFSMNESELSLNEGETGELQVISSLSFKDDKIEWSSSDEDEKVVKVAGSGDRATITAVREGTAVITAMAQTTDGVNVECKCQVTVKHVHIMSKVGEDIEPTCVKDGEKAFYRCDDETYGCERTFFDEEGTDEFSLKDIDTYVLYPPAFGHSWSEWEIVQEPTQREAGVIKRKCEFCEEEQTITTIKADPTALRDAISKVDDAKAGIASSEDGSDIEPSEKWASASAFDALDDATMKARRIEKDLDSTQQQMNDAAEELIAAIQTFTGSVKNGTMRPKASDVEKAIINATSNEGPAGTVFAPLALRSVKQTKSSITLTWNKTSKASKYVIYGNLEGKKNKMKKITSVKSSAKTKTIKKIAGKKLKKGKYYKFIIMAVDGDNRAISLSKAAHVAVKGGKVGNYKSVSVKKSVITKAGKMKVGSKLSIVAKAVKASKLKVKKYRSPKYTSTDTLVATVSSKGVISAKATGACYVYAYAQNGVYRKIKVTVK